MTYTHTGKQVLRLIGERIKAIMAVDELRPVSALARSLKVRRADVLQAVEDTDGLELIVGCRVGSWIVDYPESAWKVKRYD